MNEACSKARPGKSGFITGERSKGAVAGIWTEVDVDVDGLGMEAVSAGFPNASMSPAPRPRRLGVFKDIVWIIKPVRLRMKCLTKTFHPLRLSVSDYKGNVYIYNERNLYELYDALMSPFIRKPGLPCLD